MLRSCPRTRPQLSEIKTHSSPLLSFCVWLNIPNCSRQKKKKNPFRCFSLDSARGRSWPPPGFSLLSSGRMVRSPALLQLSCGGCLAAIYRPLKPSGGGGRRDPHTLGVCANQVALLHLLRPLLNLQHSIIFLHLKFPIVFFLLL